MSKEIIKIDSRFFLITGIVLNVVAHLFFLNRPPESLHTWRQCNTLAIARNFYEEEMNIFRARVDNRFETDGVTGSNFASYEFGLASIYKITGEQFWVHRLYSMLIFLAGGFGLLYLFELLSGNRVLAYIGFWSYLFAPDLFYFEINALPDVLSLTASIWGLYFFVKWIKISYLESASKNGFVYFVLSVLATMLAGLTKLQYLMIGFPIAALLVIHYKKILKPVPVLLLMIYAVVAVGVPVLWYKYAIELIEKSGLADFGLAVRPEMDPGKALRTLAFNLYSDLPELILNFSSFAMMLIGLYYVVKTKKYKQTMFWFFFVYAVGIMVYHVLELHQMVHHSYYMMPYYPLLLFVVAYGGYELHKRNKIALLLILLVAQPALAAYRIIPARWMSDRKLVPAELYDEASRAKLSTAVPDSALCVVGPDQSRCIHFYYLHKKGFGFDGGLFRKSKDSTLLKNYIDRGAQYLYLYDKDNNFKHERLKVYADSLLLRSGNYYVYRLRKSNKSDN